MLYIDNKQHRLLRYDYSGNGYYFITICTKQKIHYFGYIHHGIMCLNDIGTMAYQYLQQIPQHYFGVIVDAIIVMPNHVHAIVIIDKSNNTFDNLGIKKTAEPKNPVAMQPPVRTCHGMCVPGKRHNTFSKPISGSVSMIVNQYKSAVTRWCWKNKYRDFKWQPRFYDRIIRSERELYNVQQYILNNPKHWDKKF